jgi:hypothetical protein
VDSNAERHLTLRPSEQCALHSEEIMKSTMTFSAFVALTCAGYASSVSAGSPLPAATGYVQCSTSAGDFDDPSSCSTSNEAATRTLSPYATLSGSGSYPGGLVPLQGIIFAVTDFDFTVAGPDCQRRSKTRPVWRCKTRPLRARRFQSWPGPDRGLARTARFRFRNYAGRISPVSGLIRSASAA